MKRHLILIVGIALFASAGLLAQETGIMTPKEPADRDASAQAPGAAGAQSTAPRRRASMVGYIDDSTVASQVRFRFDAGFGNNVPDRAEFFYAKCGCYIFDPPPTGDKDAPGPGPGVPTELDFTQAFIQADFAVNDKFAIFGELPFRQIRPQGFLAFGSPYDPFPNQAGLADIRVGGKASLMSNDRGNASVQVRLSLPSGEPSKGLSTNSASIEPALLFHHNVNDRVGLEGQVSAWFPFDGSKGVDSTDKFSGKVISYGIGPSFDLVNTGRVRFTPVIELVGWRVIDGFQTECFADLSCNFKTDPNIVNLKFGARTTVNGKNSFYVGYGRALTDAVWYESILRFEYRMNFGGS